MSEQYVVDCEDCDLEMAWGQREHAEAQKNNHKTVNPHTVRIKVKA
jgi:hypothetical protein